MSATRNQFSFTRAAAMMRRVKEQLPSAINSARSKTMKTQTLSERTTCPKTMAGRLTTACATRLLPVLLLLAPTGVVQAQFSCTTNNGAITITGYTGPGGALTIPSAVNGLPVTSIGQYAFSSCTSLTSVTIPKSVTSMGDWAFYYCTSLTSVTIPSSVTSIGEGAFYDCASLTKITIPKSVTRIGNEAFSGCTSLTAITVDPLNSTYASVNGVLFNESQTSLIRYPQRKAGTSYAIPNSVTNIGTEAFYDCTGLTSITIPSSVTSIGNDAFSFCTGLTSVTIPNSVTSIGEWAFYGCTSLTQITIPKSVTGIGNDAFCGCRSVTAITVDALNPIYSSLDGVLFDKSQTALIQYPPGKVGGYTIPSSVTNIFDHAFYLSSLTSVTIPNNVTSIGDFAFYGCGLASVTIPSNVTSIGDMAFCRCHSLTAITVDALNSVYSSVDGALFDKNRTLLIQYPGGEAGSSYSIPNSVSNIGDDAFAGDEHLITVTIPNSVTNIFDQAFWLCPNLTGAYFKGNAPSLNGNSVFSGDNNATIYYLPGTTGWGPTFGGRPTVLWTPQVQTRDASFGVRANRFGFNITGTPSIVVVVEATTNLANPTWSPLATNTLSSGSSYFSDPWWTNYQTRFYRLRWP